MEKALFESFVRLANQLSPENLCCDGELPPAQVKKRLAAIKAEWKKLEEKVGRLVTQEEIEDTWYDQVFNNGTYR